MSVTLFDSVSVTVEAAFGEAPLAASPTYTDISAHVRGFTTSRGRSDEFTDYAPGTCQITLDNSGRLFDPEYTSGTYYGDLKPMVRVRVSAITGAGTYRIFTGFALGWPQNYTGHFDSTVVLRCVDGTRFLEQATLPTSALAETVLADSPDHYWPMQAVNGGSRYDDEIGDVALVANAATPVIVENTGPLGEPVMVGTDPTNLNFNDYWRSIYAPAPLTFTVLAAELWVNVASNVGTSGQDDDDAAASFSFETFYSPASPHPSGLDSVLFFGLVKQGKTNVKFWNADTGKGVEFYGPVLKPGLHHVAVSADATTVYLYINGQQRATGTLATTGFGYDPDWYGARIQTSTGPLTNYAMTSAETSFVSHVAVYSTAPAAARWSEHYQAGVYAYGHPFGEQSGARAERVLDGIGWPSAWRSIDTGDTIHGAYLPAKQKALVYLRDVEQGENGALFFAADGAVKFRSRNGLWTAAAASKAYTDDPADNDLYRDITVDSNSIAALRNKATVTYATGYIVVQDDTSITDYGENTETISAPTVASPDTARGLAAYTVRTKKDPATQITRLEVNPRRNPADMYDTLIGIEIGDAVTVEVRPMGGTVITKNVAVQGIQHRVTAAGEWASVLYLAPAEDSYSSAPYLTFGDATYGKFGVTAGNLIPF